MMSFLFGSILLISISLTIAVRLDGNCSANEQCEDVGAYCSADKCQCKIPYYLPCKSSCALNRHFAYEGDQCEEPENCVANSICSLNRCACGGGYTGYKGLCLKALNIACANPAECWSQHCSGSVCTCAVGYEPRDDGIRCRRKFVNIYSNWNEANQSNAFCSDSSSCVHIRAECYTDPQYPTAKFCKCPYGFKVEDDHQRCEPIESTLLSPLDSKPSVYGECGACPDENAACVKVGNQTTCWCRSGYVKANNACAKEDRKKPLLIFPNPTDIAFHDFTSGCANEPNSTTRVNGNLCVCAPGFKFVTKDQPCAIIERKWINNIYEYGVCTTITSGDEANVENGLCPEPLKCEAREDKHVCSCGNNKFLSLDDPTQCVYFVNQKTSSENDTCPINAERNATTGICKCRAGYIATDLNRQCEVKLSSDKFQPSCNTDRSNDAICAGFGKKALLCTDGECRCSGNQSFSNKAKTHCYAPLNETLVGTIEDCPLNSSLKNQRCVCNDGSRPSSDSSECVDLNVQLVNYAGSPTNTTGDITTEDCQAIFIGPVETYDGVRCRCKIGSVINNDQTGCWYRPNFTFSVLDKSALCSPNSTISSTAQCECNSGYTNNGSECVLKTKQVYAANDSTAPNVTNLGQGDCKNIFGYGADLSRNGQYCICQSAAYRVKDNSYCHFLINITTSDIKRPKDCPDNTVIYPLNLPYACICKPGYHMTSNSQTCEIRNIVLVGTENVATPHPSNCSNFTNDDCIAKFGEQAFCRNENCYCDRRLSFINAEGKCESFSNYVFPGVHELSSYSCNTDEDCGDNQAFECDYLNGNRQFKVCQCEDGSLLDPKTQKCVENRCKPECNTNSNFECLGYQCVCKQGYYQNNAECVKITSELQLNRPCNLSAVWSIAETAGAMVGLQCNGNCSYARCIPGFRPEGSSCVRFQLGNDKCEYQENACEAVDVNAICNRNENHCACNRLYYFDGKTCVPAVDTRCKNDKECGGEMLCRSQRCKCNDSQKTEQTQDVYGQPIERCINGVGQVRFSMVLLLFVVLVRVFFA